MKKIFKSKSLPGLSKEELNKLTSAKAANQEQGKYNVESGHLANIQPLALEGFLNSDYWHSEEHIASLSKAGVASSVVNLKKGNIGKDSKMSMYKMDKNRRKWAIAILPLGRKHWLPAEIKELITNKQWYSVRHRTDFTTRLDKKGGYHNTQYYYKLNLKEVKKYANMSEPKFSDY